MSFDPCQAALYQIFYRADGRNVDLGEDDPNFNRGSAEERKRGSGDENRKDARAPGTIGEADEMPMSFGQGRADIRVYRPGSVEIGPALCSAIRWFQIAGIFGLKVFLVNKELFELLQLFGHGTA
jgi:hypothetical protein